MSIQTVRTRKFRAELCRGSYHQFFKELWPTVVAEKLIDSWYIKRACDKLQAIAEKVIRDEPKEGDFIYNCPPGSSKSSIFSIFLQPWTWTRMPSMRFITGSYSERLALDLSRKSRDVILSDKYQSFYPEITLRDDQNTKSFFVNKQGGFRYATGVGGAVIGQHAHMIVIDDPIDPQGVLSDLIIAESNIWGTETLGQRKVNLLLTPTITVMQRLHQNDFTGHLLDKNKKVVHWQVPCDSTWEIKPAEFKEYYQSDSNGLPGVVYFDPVRYSQSALEDAFDRLGEVGYACQFGQSPVPRGGAMFKIDRLSYQARPPERWRRGPMRYWDKAATAGGGSFTVGVKGGIDLEDNFWVLDVVRGQWDSGTREKIILDTAVLDGKGVRIGIEQEPGAGGKEAAENAQRTYSLRGFRCTVDKVRASKEERAVGGSENRPDSLAVRVNTGKAILLNAPWNKAFVEELKYFPRSRYKDQVDATSGLYGMLAVARSRIGVL